MLKPRPQRFGGLIVDAEVGAAAMTSQKTWEVHRKSIFTVVGLPQTNKQQQTTTINKIIHSGGFLTD